HCVKDTDGWQIIPELKVLCEEKGCKCYDKPTFGSTALAADLKKAYEAGELESVELVGICTDICVVSNALLIKAFMPELPVSLDSACCAGVTPEKHEAALETMRSCQILVK
ncbi:MAG: cysteine hydrolase, partial [Lachnospiraceae bacterium]|nr:cysteine hydrolase [Lachnospiraceae bacterium]